MKRFAWVLGVGLAGLAIMAGHSEAKIEITGAALVSAQDVDFDSTTGNLDEDFNFNDPRINLYIVGSVTENISVTANLWCANEWTQERSGGNMDMGDAIEFGELFLTLKNVAGSKLNLSIGQIDIPYGWEWKTRVGNGDMSASDFITNSLLDISGTDEGAVVSGSFDAGQGGTPVTWQVAVSNGDPVNDGNPGGAGPEARGNKDLSWAAQAEAGMADNLTVQASYYTNDLRKDNGTSPLNFGSTLLVNSLAGRANNPNLAGLATEQAQGFDHKAWEASAKYTYGDGYILGFFGNIEADTSTTANRREWDYMGIQGRYNFDENSYLAVRWNQLDPNYTASSNVGQPSLWSVAAGYKLSDGATVRAEWTSFDEDGDGFGSPAANTRDNVSSDATALNVAVGVKF